MREKILYIMGVEWNWIFQRPQILEQHLEKKYDVTVVFPKSILRWKQRKNSGTLKPDKLRILRTFPRQERYALIGRISQKIAEKIFRDVQQFDAVIIGYPLYYRYIPKEYEGVVIYDCMDFFRALYPDPKSVSRLISEEESLVRRCDALVVSAEKLRSDLWKNVLQEKVVLIRNGTFVKKVYLPQLKPHTNKLLHKIGYFGTIAHWFDYDLLISSCKKHNNIEYHLIGPVVTPCPSGVERIVMEGIVPNAELADYTKDYDCLIMPFIVNDVVEWVDPVKLYEYIALGKCIISVRYAEIERFEPYVYMYTDENEYENLLEKLSANGFPAKYTAEQQCAFLNENSWECRFEQWDALLDECMQNGRFTEGKEQNEN